MLIESGDEFIWIFQSNTLQDERQIEELQEKNWKLNDDLSAANREIEYIKNDMNRRIGRLTEENTKLAADLQNFAVTCMRA